MSNIRWPKKFAASLLEYIIISNDFSRGEGANVRSIFMGPYFLASTFVHEQKLIYPTLSDLFQYYFLLYFFFCRRNTEIGSVRHRG